ncbi:MAG: NADP-dependent malic enzyme [Candidatus Anammoxibacter sp.]
MIKKEDVLHYHSSGRKGKLEVIPTKPCLTQRDLSLAYTPGVAIPCLEIAENQQDVYEYTSKGNLIGVITNGTAVLGLGNIGPAASKPVMEGKAILFKRFADIDVFDLEINTQDPDEFINAVALLEPTFGGINLEDIKAPECFYIEEELQKRLKIPVFHDDQHGTAIISGAALINALELAGKKIEDAKFVINGAGAAGIACAKHFEHLGAKRANIILCDTKGVIYKGRKVNSNKYKDYFAIETEKRTLSDAFIGADVFLGYSVGGAVTKEMVKSMNDNPIVFALANPDPEISYDDALSARDDVIMATGRSDYPNQVNNVLGFPYIFRGALDVRAKAINIEMKVAATMALVKLTREDVPDSVARTYGVKRFEFGRDYIIVTPFDPRVMIWEASAVAEAAMKTGVAQLKIDIDEYRDRLEFMMGKSREIMRIMINKAKKTPKRIVYPEGENEKILRAANIVVEENIAKPILLGNRDKIIQKIEDLHLALKDVEIINPNRSPMLNDYAAEFYKMRSRKGVTIDHSKITMINPNYYGSMMVHLGDADGLVSGVMHQYPDTIRPALQVIGTKNGVKHVAGVYLMIIKNDVKLFADATVNIDTSPEILAEIALLCAEQAKQFDIEPRIAMLSFSNFGSSKHPLAIKVKKATEIVKKLAPELVVDGEMDVDMAVMPKLRDENYPFANLKEAANVLIFPDLTSGNIAYKLLKRLGGAEAIGPILMGMKKPVHLLQVGSSDVKDVVNMTAIAVVDAQNLSGE